MYNSGARETEFTGHTVWSHNAHVIMEKKSHLKLMTMGLLQTCSYITEQMQSNVTIDINTFLKAFSIEDNGYRIFPPTWVPQASSSITPSMSTNHFDMDDYRISRQIEAIRWINLQEKRSSIIPRLQPTTAEEYNDLCDAVTSDSGPLRRKVRKARKQPGTDLHQDLGPLIYFIFIIARKHQNQSKKRKSPDQQENSSDEFQELRKFYFIFQYITKQLKIFFRKERKEAKKAKKAIIDQFQ